MSDITEDADKLARLDWLARVYSNDAQALDSSQDKLHLLEVYDGWGTAQFVEAYRPLTKLIETRGPCHFTLANVRHVAPDLSFADLTMNGETLFVLYARFEASAPWRVRYWNSWPPLPSGVAVRRYTPEDAPGCVELERACPMELEDDTSWVIDRGAQFHNYLQLMGEIDAAVLVADERIVGFYSCALRPVHFNGQDTHCVYQHHYRVHPDFREGSVSQALAGFVDPRRTFESTEAQFPYAMIDAKNAHVRNMGFPGIENVTIARLAVPLLRQPDGEDPATAEAGRPDAAQSQPAQGLFTPDAEQICTALNQTHGTRTLYKPIDAQALAQRCELIETYSASDFFALQSAVLGVWRSGERNVLTRNGRQEIYHLAFALDYGFGQTTDLLALIDALAPSLAADGITHLCFLCDTRAPEYAPLFERATDVAQLGWHTIPLLAEVFQANTIYCDVVYC